MDIKTGRNMEQSVHLYNTVFVIRAKNTYDDNLRKIGNMSYSEKDQGSI